MKQSKAKQAISGFVAHVTTSGGPDFVTPAQRIAVVDNDGSLWTEQPVYVQVAFAFDRIKALAPQRRSQCSSRLRATRAAMRPAGVTFMQPAPPALLRLDVIGLLCYM